MQKHAKQKTDFADFTSRVKLLLELMTSNSAEGEKNRNSPDVSDSESDCSDEDPIDAKEPKESLKDKAFHLKNFFDEEVDSEKKIPPSTGDNSIWDSYKFEEKMYRVFPVRLDRGMITPRRALKRKAT